MNFSKVKQIVGSALVCTMLLGQSAFALTGWTEYSYPIGVGTTYTRQEGNNESGVQKASIITYTPNSSVMPIIRLEFLFLH